MKTPLLSILFLCISISITAQVSVSATQGTANATYTTLKAAFDAVNAGAHQGVLTITITDNTTETAAAVLYQSGYNATSSYSSVSIYPTVAGKSISGSLATPLIDLNGADNVTIDGRLNASGSTVDLTINNTSASSVAGTSTVRFTNDACSNIVNYCIVKGSSRANIGANILFYGTVSLGNSNNSILYNEITSSSDANRPYKIVYASAGAAPLNSSNIISGNKCYNFISTVTSSNGIFLDYYNSGWTISGNSFYETGTFVPASSFTIYIMHIRGLAAVSSSTLGHVISGNYIGGNAPLCSGTFTKTGLYANSFYGIYLSPYGTTPTEIQGNVIKGFDYSNASVASSFYGIFTLSGGATTVNIGTTSPNIIGASTGTNAILFRPADASGSCFYGINTFTATNGITNVSNNIIGSVTVANTTATNAGGFRGIFTQSGYGRTTISNNVIGSTVTSNSINATSASSGNAQLVYGIYSVTNETNIISGNTIDNLTNGTTNSTAGTAGFIQGIVCEAGYYSVNGNTIRNLSISNANSSITNTVSAAGIVLNVTGSNKSQNISGNTIYNIANTNASSSGGVAGIYYSGTTSSSLVDKNLIYGLSVSAGTAAVYGIKIAAGSTTYSNNIITLGANTSNVFYGVYENGAANHNNSLYFNSVYIYGSPTTDANNSYCLYNAVSTNTRDFRNNIFMNARTNNGATGSHYALYFNHGVADNLTLNYNDYYVSGIGGILARYNNVDVNTLPIIATNDGSSLNIDPQFASAGGVLPLNYLPGGNVNGTALDWLRHDHNGYVRSSSQPKMGAVETTTSTLAALVYINNALVASYGNLKTAFDRINDGTHTGSIQIRLAADQILSTTATLNASGTGSASYTDVLIYPTIGGLTISGNISGAPLVDLDGADNVTIDGRVNAAGVSKSLTIINNSPSSTLYTSTIRYINDATNNVVKYCSVKGAGSAAEGGIIYLSTTTGSSGNDQILIDNNNITGVSRAFRPVNGILSSGSTAKENSDILITNNYIFDLAENGTTYYVYLSSNSTTGTISNNHFYETVAYGLSSTAGASVIYISSATGSGFTIHGNYIGGSAPYCAGTAWTKNNAGNGTFNGIYISSANTLATSIQGNTITNFDWSNSANGSWLGMFVLGSAVNIGNVTGNTIGAASGTGAITITAGSTGGFIYGFSINNGGTSICSNNIVASIKINNSNSTAGSTFYGIQKNTSAATLSILNNTIGSNTANSIELNSPASSNSQAMIGITSSGSGQVIISGNSILNLTNRTTNTNVATVGRSLGIYCNNTGTHTVTNNVIHDISNANANTNSSGMPSAAGLILDVTSTAAQTISGNTIYNISNAFEAFTGTVTGIYVNAGVANTSVVEKNMVRGLSVNSGSTSASIYGLKMNAGTVNWINNIVSIGYTSGSSIDGVTYGAYENGTAGSTSSWYHNTLQLNGIVSAGSANSYAFYSNSNLNTRDFRNNIISNTRSNGGATGTHFGAFFNYATAGAITLDYNDYYVSGTGTVLGYFNSANVSALPLISGLDAASISSLPGFSDPVGTTALHYVPSSAFSGVIIAGISDDHISTVRGTPPTIGAMEFSASLPARWVFVTGKVINRSVQIDWQVANETVGSNYVVQFSSNAIDWKNLTIVSAKGLMLSSYSFIHSTPLDGKNFYRIVETDPSGRTTQSKIIIVDLSASVNNVIIMGNPVRNGRILVNAASNSNFMLFAVNGQVLVQKHLEKGWQYVELAGLAKGVYVVKVGLQTAKLIVE